MDNLENKEPLSESEISAIVSSAVHTTGDWADSNLSNQRADAYDFFFGSEPAQTSRGRSEYTSLDVLDGVESLQASMLNVFDGRRRVVKFEPNVISDAMQTDQANHAMDFILSAQNDATFIHRTAICDGLLSKMGVFKVYYEKERVAADFPFEGTRDQLDVILAGEGELTVKFEMDEPQIRTELETDDPEKLGEVKSETEMVSVMLTEWTDNHTIKVDVVAPEEFLVDERANCVEDAVFTCHQREVTIGELREMGFDEDKIEEVGAGSQDTKMSTNYERIARKQYDDTGTFSTITPIADESMSYVTLLECYLKADYEGTGMPIMRQIFMVNNVILEMEEVDVNPFHAFVPFPISHKLYGQSIADRLAGIQIQKSKLTRAILDNAELNNNTRYIANVSQLENPRELTDTRFGGVVRAKGMVQGIVNELAKPQLSPQTFPTLQLLDTAKEERTGVNKMANGLDEDAMKPGNAATKVNQLLQLSQLRQKAVAQQYMNAWAKVYNHMYNLAISYMPFLEIPNPKGEAMILRPMEWRTGRVATVTDTLAFGEAEQKANQLIQLDRMITQDPAAAQMYGPEQKKRVVDEVFELFGYESGFLNDIDPNYMPPAQQQQLKLQQQQVQQQQAANMMAQQNLQLAKMDREIKQAQVQGDLMIRKQQLELDQRKAQSAATNNAQKLEMESRYKVDSLDIEETNSRIKALAAEMETRYKTDLIDLEEQRLELDKQKLAMESILEAQQQRGVDLG